MMTHLVTLGPSAGLLADGLTGIGLSAGEWTPGEAIPAATVGALGDAADPMAWLSLASTLSGRSEAMLLLVANALAVREGNLLSSAARKKACAEQFAAALSLSSTDTHVFLRGVLLHDLGKLELRNDLLLTKALLTHGEWEQLRRYPVLGAALCDATPGLEDLAELVGGHQECFDGTGYPEGIEGDNIPYLARAARLVIVYCAMTSPRAYRAGHATAAEARTFIESELGKHFDPELGQAFLGLDLPSEG